MAAVATIICLLTAPFDRNRKLVHQFACFWGYHYIMLNPFWRCRFIGLEQLERDKTYVLVSNHQSYWDIMVLYGLFRQFKWVAKESVLKIPFIGWNMRINQYVSVARDDLKSIKAMMASCKEWLARDASLLIFPEGTRSEDGELGKFRDGPFKLAMEAGVPVVPIVLDGTYQILPKNAKSLKFRSDIVVRVLPPIYPQAYEGQPRLMREHVHQCMLETLAQVRASAL
jgi:1-acyl-sn-glycerol-3-phosphate acyltransferase